MSLTEATAAKGPLAAPIAEGVRVISQDQEITFTRYVQVVLPLDGFVFWVRASIISPAALLNYATLNAFSLNQSAAVAVPANQLKIRGSLHYSTDQYQLEDESFALNRVVFSALSEVQDLNEVGGNSMYIGEFDGLQFAFSQRGLFYQQADLYHYRGEALYPAMRSQIIDDPLDLDTRNVVVSNSLPVWLALGQFVFPYPLGIVAPTAVAYPSYLVDNNRPPPYISVHIDPGGTRALASAPLLGRSLTHTQLCADRVRLTTYGLRNFNALDFMDYVNQYSLDTDVIGIMNMPVVRDEKRQQNEFSVLAMKKTIEYEVSYYQSRIRDVARQLILHCIPSYHFAP